MRRVVIAGLLAVVVAGVASSGVGARQTSQAPNVPGMPTQARMVVVNGAGEPIPVVIGSGGQVQPVTVVGTPSVLLSADTVVTTREGRQAWEYRSIAVPSGQDAAVAANAAGAEGWEAVGVTPAAAGASQVLMKRPR
jgi:hypothetical protein